MDKGRVSRTSMEFRVPAGEERRLGVTSNEPSYGMPLLPVRPPRMIESALSRCGELPARSLLLLSAVAFLLLAASNASSQCNDLVNQARTPDPANLQSGDLLWPKQEGAIILFSADETQSELPTLWEAERDGYLEQLRVKSVGEGLTAMEIERFAYLSHLDWEGFLSLFTQDQDPFEPTPFSLLNRVQVGHVAIVDVRDGVPWVIEANFGPGVHETQYDEWLTERGPNALVWHARMRRETGDRKRVAEVARSQVGKRYKFFNFDLEDASGFYCSKLVWYSVKEGLDFAIDGNDQPERKLWYTPLMLFSSRDLCLLSSPGDYRNR
ncbi:MAG: hypothetical protein H6682_11290 [Candidatus Eisenbacteria bacterium]|nr:hypothetical protein [Candidatus Eisenbacteria bacterium]